MNRALIHEVMAVMGRKGGRASTPEKVAAARKNGKLGGRPRGSKNKAKR
jgi:hypothetical protein